MHLGIIGYGAIGRTLVELLDGSHGIDEVTVLTRPGRQGELPSTAAQGARVTAVTEVDEFLAASPSFVVECAGHQAAASLVPPILEAGTDVVFVSVGAMADDGLAHTLRRAAASGGARLILPAGAVGGVDILRAVAPGGDLTVRYTGRKPPPAWAGSPAEAVLDLTSVDVPTAFFTGTAREAATQYPKNANVAATLALAGAGLDRTEVTLIADPEAPGNIHEFEVASPVADISMRIAGKPSKNARTSLATIYSVLREIRNHQGPVVI